MLVSGESSLVGGLTKPEVVVVNLGCQIFYSTSTFQAFCLEMHL